MILDSFFQQFKPVSFKKAALLLQPDDTPKGVYYLEKGFVKLYSLTEWGDEKLHLIYKPSEMFPLFWTFGDVPLAKYYEAFTDITVRISPKHSFLQFIEKNPEALRSLIKKMTQIMEVYSSRIDNLEYTNATARLCTRLIYLATRFGEKQGTQLLIPIPLTQKDIASSIAITRETVSREFEILEQKGIVKYVNHLIVICSMEELQKEVSSHFNKQLQ